MFKLSLSQVKLLNMNNASMSIHIDGKTESYFITRKNFNKLLRGKELDVAIVTKPDKYGTNLNWVATLSIF